MIDLLHDKYIIDYASKFKYSLFTSCNESRLQTETYSVAFGIFRECGTVFYRVRYGAVRCIHLVIPQIVSHIPVVRIRILIGTTVVRIRILIGTTVVRIASAKENIRFFSSHCAMKLVAVVKIIQELRASHCKEFKHCPLVSYYTMNLKK